MYHDKESFKEIASRLSPTLNFGYLIKAVSKMSKDRNAEDHFNIIFQRDLPIGMDMTRCYDILSRQFYGHDWNFISGQFKRINGRKEKLKRYLSRLVEQNNTSTIRVLNNQKGFTVDSFSSMDYHKLLEHIANSVKIKDAEVVGFLGQDFGSIMKGNQYLMSQELKIKKGDHTCIAYCNVIIDDSNGQFLSIEVLCEPIQVEVDYTEVQHFIGKKYESLCFYSSGYKHYYVMSVNRVGDKDYHELLDTLVIDYEDFAIVIADEISELSPNLSLVDDYYLSNTFAWNKPENKPVTQLVGKTNLLIPLTN